MPSGYDPAMLSRRRFVGTVGVSFLAAPLVGEAQQVAKIARIGYLAGDLAGSPQLPEAFRQGLRDLGYVEGRNVVIEYRDAEEKVERLPALSAELVALKVDVIVAPTTVAALAAKHTEPGRMVVAVTGDGDFLMTGQELATAVRHDLAVTGHAGGVPDRGSGDTVDNVGVARSG